MIADEGWREALRAELPKGYPERVAAGLASKLDAGEVVTPPLSSVFRALDMVPLDGVRAVIVGQDPYPNAGDADGLAFSTSRGGRLPSSLARILAEYRRDCGYPRPCHGDLSPWARQGVLLLNSALTTKVGDPMAHGDLGWDAFTRAVLRIVACRAQMVVVMLWGREARALASEFDGTGHRLLLSDHPRASRRLNDPGGVPFKGSRPFSRANDFLRRHGRHIDWRL